MIKLNGNIIGYCEVFITGLIWGTIGLFVKELTKLGAGSTLIVFFRVFFAFVFALIVSLCMYGPKCFKVSKQQLFWCFLNGIITQAFSNYMYSMCVNNVGVALAAILLYTSPIFNAIISFIAFKEKLGFKKNMILVLNMIGCIVAVTGFDFSFKNVSIFGIIAGLLSGLTYGMAPVLGKYANTGENTNLFSVIMYNEFFASICMIILGKPQKYIEIFSTKMWIYGIIFGVFVTGVAYIFYYDGVKRITELSKVPVIASVETVVASLIGLFIYSEKLNIYNILGIVLVLMSIVLMSNVKEKQIK